MTLATHIPRGFMCCDCKYALDKCSHLDFTKMKVIGTFKEDGVKEVSCTQRIKVEKTK